MKTVAGGGASPLSDHIIPRTLHATVLLRIVISQEMNVSHADALQAGLFCSISTSLGMAPGSRRQIAQTEIRMECQKSIGNKRVQTGEKPGDHRHLRRVDVTRYEERTGYHERRIRALSHKSAHVLHVAQRTIIDAVGRQRIMIEGEIPFLGCAASKLAVFRTPDPAITSPTFRNGATVEALGAGHPSRSPGRLHRQCLFPPVTERVPCYGDLFWTLPCDAVCLSF